MIYLHSDELEELEETIKYEVEKADAGLRLDEVVTKICRELTRNTSQKLIESKNVTVNFRPAIKSLRIKSGDIISIQLPNPQPLDLIPENIPLDILYEDKELIVINKLRGIVVHPAPGHYTGTLVHALLFHCKGNLSGINGVQRPGVVHRIDKDTSGVIVFAKTDNAYLGLAKQLSKHEMERRYHAIAIGSPKDDFFTINKPIGRHQLDRKKMAVTEKKSRTAVTHVQILERFSGCVYLEAQLETGRTHQIRVHMSHIGYPLLGDTVYGGNNKSILNIEGGQTLHAKKLGFLHPTTGKFMLFETELPQYFKNALKLLRQKSFG